MVRKIDHLEFLDVFHVRRLCDTCCAILACLVSIINKPYLHMTFFVQSPNFVTVISIKLAVFMYSGTIVNNVIYLLNCP